MNWLQIYIGYTLHIFFNQALLQVVTSFIIRPNFIY